MKTKSVISFLMAYSLLLLLSSTVLAAPCPCGDCPACYESTGPPGCGCTYVGCDPPCDGNSCYDCNASCECEYRCDPNLLCEVCDGNGVCEACDPNLCEVCDGNGVCEVCSGDPNLICCNGVCCDPNLCESCVDGLCQVCGGDPNQFCCDGNCCIINCEACVDSNCVEIDVNSISSDDCNYVNCDILFQVTTDPCGYEADVSWSAPGGDPNSGTGSTFTTHWGTKGVKTVTASICSNSKSKDVNICDAFECCIDGNCVDPRCDDCQHVTDILYECFHWATDPPGTPCLTTECLMSILDSASCTDKGPGWPCDKNNCDTKVITSPPQPEIMMYRKAVRCPGGTVSWTLWRVMYYGCDNDCAGLAYLKACETHSCSGGILIGSQPRGSRKWCGC